VETDVDQTITSMLEQVTADRRRRFSMHQPHHLYLFAILVPTPLSICLSGGAHCCAWPSRPGLNKGLKYPQLTPLVVCDLHSQLCTTKLTSCLTAGDDVLAVALALAGRLGVKYLAQKESQWCRGDIRSDGLMIEPRPLASSSGR
jgi:hypothetical protein